MATQIKPCTFSILQRVEILLGFYSVIFAESLCEVAEIGISDFIAYFGYRVK
ncbi:hypothetical protein HMPREF1981_02510, partial [Bacteroides pyogenes F0041]